ncbi:MAG: aminotransferase class III-fold pyridoxal phosphate-dependent enzyme [Bryobacterales bacterium]|nr:aminotransferase class III-fold pyridoxal phosphate-dependent enzyme [Bryobacterales bacterium]
MEQTVLSSNRELDLEHLWHGNLQHHGLDRRPPLEVAGADGCWIWDAEGRRYLDGMAGLWCVNVGYGRRRIVDAVAAQMAQMPYYPLTQSHGPGARLAARLAGLLPPELSRVFFLNSGSEAVETALKIARLASRRLHPRENRFKIISRYRAYHGFTMGAMSATGQAFRKRGFEPLVPGFFHVVPPDPYHCDFCSREPGCTLACADEFDRVIRMEGPDTVAAIIMEPVIGGGGVLPAPEGYIRRVREICDRYGVLLILDEVITGFGRTGKLFGFEHSGVTPDIATFAKGLTSAYLPLAATVATDHVFQAFSSAEDDSAKFTQVSTFGGHPCSCAAGLANLDILTEERLWENSARVGAYLQNRLIELRAPSIGEIRGVGLLLGIEMVEAGTRTPMRESQVISMQRAIRDRGVIVGRNNDTAPGLCNTLTISPPLTLTESEADIIVEAISASL